MSATATVAMSYEEITTKLQRVPYAPHACDPSSPVGRAVAMRAKQHEAQGEVRMRRKHIGETIEAAKATVARATEDSDMVAVAAALAAIEVGERELKRVDARLADVAPDVQAAEGGVDRLWGEAVALMREAEDLVSPYRTGYVASHVADHLAGQLAPIVEQIEQKIGHW